MVKRPPFEEANYPPPESKATSQWITFGIIIAAIAVIAVFSYNYWDGSNWGWLVSVQKP